MEDNKKRGEGLKFLKGLLKLVTVLVIVLVIIVGIGIGGILGYSKYKEVKKQNEFYDEVVINPVMNDSQEEAFKKALGIIEDNLEKGEKAEFDPLQSKYVQEAILRDSEAEIYGIPAGEALDLGIDVFREDTSGNGLLDAEAISLGLDPTVYSSARDGISDMVKLMEGYDPTEKVKIKKEFNVEFEEYGLRLKTKNLNDKYFTYVQSYEMEKVNNMYDSVIAPFQIKEYQGNIELDIPENVTENDLVAYQFDYDNLELIKVKKQKYKEKDNILEMTIANGYPIFIIGAEGEKNIDETFIKENEKGTFHYFRVSIPYIENIVGFNHKVFLFQESSFLSFNSDNEIIVDDNYGIADFTTQKIGKVSVKILTGIFELLGDIYENDATSNSVLGKGGIVDYGTSEGTYIKAKYRVMPWLDEELRKAFEKEQEEIEENREKTEAELLELEKEEMETWDSEGPLVADTGFNIKKNAFRFANFSTDVSTGGTCAGFSLLTEKNFNGDKISSTEQANAKTILGNIAYDDEISYDISNNKDDYSFLQDKNQYGYLMSDSKTKMMTDGNSNTRYEKPLILEELGDPDSSLINMLVVNYLELNDNNLKLENFLYDKSRYEAIDQVIETLNSGKIATISMTKGPGGHSINAYKAEQDGYDPDKLHLYVYDNSIPYEKIVEYSKGSLNELTMTIVKKRKTVRRTDNLQKEEREYFEFDYTPLKDHGNKSWSWSNEGGSDLSFSVQGNNFKY